MLATATARKLSLRTGLAAAAFAALGTGVALAAGTFDDVPSGHTHEAGIEYVADAGITQGCTPTTYCPADAVRRDQMATFLHRASGNDPSTPPSVNADKVDGLHAHQLLAAAVHVKRDGANNPVVERWTNNVNGTAPTITGGNGFYEIDFGFNVGSRFPQCTVDTNFVDTRDAICTVSIPSGTKVRVRTHDVSADALAAAEFWLTLQGDGSAELGLGL